MLQQCNVHLLPHLCKLLVCACWLCIGLMPCVYCVCWLYMIFMCSLYGLYIVLVLSLYGAPLKIHRLPTHPLSSPTLFHAHPPPCLYPTDELGVSSLHMTFNTKEEHEMMKNMGFLSRVGIQYHWDNEGYSTFDDFLGALKQSKRKNIRQVHSLYCVVDVSYSVWCVVCGGRGRVRACMQGVVYGVHVLGVCCGAGRCIMVRMSWFLIHANPSCAFLHVHSYHCVLCTIAVMYYHCHVPLLIYE